MARIEARWGAVPRLEAAGLLAVLAVAAAMRFVGIGAQSYWTDEAITALVMGHSFGGLLESVQDRATPHLYYVLSWGWAQLFGAGEGALRSLSALLGLASVAVLWAAARRMAGAQPAFAAAALMAVNPMLVWYSQEARTYPLLVLLATVTLLALALLEERPTGRRWALWSVASVAALLTHYFAVFLIVPQAALLAWRHRARLRAVALAALPPGLVGLCLVPLARSQAGTGTEWIADTPLWWRVKDLLQELASANTWVVSSSTPHPQRVWWVLAAAGVAVAVVSALTARPSPRRRLAVVAGAGAVVVIGLPTLLALASVDYLLDRNVIVAWPLLAIALGAALTAARWPAAGWTGLAAIVIASAGIQAAIVRQPDLQRHDWRGAIETVSDHDLPRLFLPQPSYAMAPVRLYVEGAQEVRPGAPVGEIVVLGPEVNPDRLPPSMLDLPLVEAGRIQAHLGLARFRAAEPVELTAEDIATLGPGVWQPSARSLDRASSKAGG